MSWRDNTVVDKPIWVVDGTLFNVIGNGSGAGLDGNDETLFFTAVNALLYIIETNILLEMLQAPDPSLHQVHRYISMGETLYKISSDLTVSP